MPKNPLIFMAVRVLSPHSEARAVSRGSAGGTFWEIAQMIEHSPGFGLFTPFACAPGTRRQLILFRRQLRGQCRKKIGLALKISLKLSAPPADESVVQGRKGESI